MITSQGQKRKHSVGAEDHDGEPRRSHRTNIGKNGRTEQLEKVAVRLGENAGRRLQAVPDAAPVNPMAPVAVPRAKRKKMRAPEDGSGEKGTDARVDAPIPSFRLAKEGDRFGFRNVHNSQRKSSPPNDGSGEEEHRAEHRRSDGDDDRAMDEIDGGSNRDEYHNDYNPDLPRRSEDAEDNDRASEPLYFPRSTPPLEANESTKKGGHAKRSNVNVSERDNHDDSYPQRAHGRDIARNGKGSKSSQCRDHRRENRDGVDDVHRSRRNTTKGKSKVTAPPSKGHGSKRPRPVEPDDEPHDVLQRHLSKNGRVRLPSTGHPQQVRSNSRESRHSSSPEDDSKIGNRLVLSDDPTCLNYYPPLTKAFLRRCKLLVRAHYAIRNPFITLETAIQGIGLEILAEVNVEYKQKQLPLEDGQYPEYRHPMARLLYNENGNFRSELKGVVISAVRQHYKELQIPEGSRWTAKQGIEYVKRSASRVLQNGDWLRGPPGRDGKVRNFSHDAIKHACLVLYYKSSSRTSLRNCKEFSTTVPPFAVALVVAAIKLVLVAYQNHGQPKVPTINEDTCGRALHNAKKGVQEVLEHAEHAKYFKCMLQDWVQQERVGQVIDYSGESDSDFGLVFD